MNFRWAAVVLVLCGALELAAKTTQSTIKVVIKNQYDKPVANASVILDFLGSRQVTKLLKKKPIHWEVHTNQEGIAHFPPVPQGTVQLQVITKQYQTFGEKVEADEEEKTVEITLNPPQKQYSAHPPLKPADPPKEQPRQ